MSVKIILGIFAVTIALAAVGLSTWCAVTKCSVFYPDKHEEQKHTTIVEKQTIIPLKDIMTKIPVFKDLDGTKETNKFMYNSYIGSLLDLEDGIGIIPGLLQDIYPNIPYYEEKYAKINEIYTNGIADTASDDDILLLDELITYIKTFFIKKYSIIDPTYNENTNKITAVDIINWLGKAIIIFYSVSTHFTALIDFGFYDGSSDIYDAYRLLMNYINTHHTMVNMDNIMYVVGIYDKTYKLLTEENTYIKEIENYIQLIDDPSSDEYKTVLILDNLYLDILSYKEKYRLMNKTYINIRVDASEENIAAFEELLQNINTITGDDIDTIKNIIFPKILNIADTFSWHISGVTRLRIDANITIASGIKDAYIALLNYIRTHLTPTMETIIDIADMEDEQGNKITDKSVYIAKLTKNVEEMHTPGALLYNINYIINNDIIPEETSYINKSIKILTIQANGAKSNATSEDIYILDKLTNDLVISINKMDIVNEYSDEEIKNNAILLTTTMLQLLDNIVSSIINLKIDDTITRSSDIPTVMQALSHFINERHYNYVIL